MSKSNEIVPAGEQAPNPSGDIALIMGDVLPEIEDPEQAQRAIVAQVLQAESLQQVFADHSTIATKEMVGVPLRITDGRLMSGNLGEGDSVYMVIDAVDLRTGEIVVLNTGAPKIMAIVYRIKQMGKLPVEAEVVEAGRARPGQNAPLGLRAIGETAEAVADV